MVKCVYCGSERTFRENGILVCHDCGCADVEELDLRLQQPEDDED